MAEDIVRLVRILEYIGPRTMVERGLRMVAVPLNGERVIGNEAVIRSAMIGSFAEIITQAQTGLVLGKCPDCSADVTAADNYVIPNKHDVDDVKDREYVHLACYDSRGVRAAFAPAVAAALADEPDPATVEEAVEVGAALVMDVSPPEEETSAPEPTYTNAHGTFKVGDQVTYLSHVARISGIDLTNVFPVELDVWCGNYLHRPAGADDIQPMPPEAEPAPAPAPHADDDIPF